MNWAGKQHPVETLVEWTAPIPLALSAGWAASMLGHPVTTMAVAGLIAFASGLFAMRMGGERPAEQMPSFEIADLDGSAWEPGELLLDDPLVETEDDSRVVRLFAKDEPTPGELVARIADYLGAERQPDGPAEAPLANRPSADASAALHAALANIRANLR